MSSRARLAILASAIAIVVYSFLVKNDWPYWAARLAFHNGILERTIEAPFRYRVLTVWLAEGMGQVFSGSHVLAVMLTHMVLGATGIAVFIVATYLFLERWYGGEWALIGALFTCVSFHAINLWYAQSHTAYTPVEMSLIGVALLCLQRIFFTQPSSS